MTAELDGRKPAGPAQEILGKMLTTLTLCTVFVTGTALAQEVRYSWLDLSYRAQDFDRQGFQVPVQGQSVEYDAGDGDGVRFRGSIGTWNNIYAFIDYGSTDIGVAAVIRNEQGEFLAEDEFDLTTIRGGLGFKYAIGFSTDLIAEISYDSLDLDFGSFAGEDFDASDQDLGGLLGVRSMLNDELEVRASARYTNHETVDLTLGEFDTGVVYGAGFGYEIVRGLSIVGDYESGQFANWSLGFRLDLDED
jgi:hypothetical protein